jgi:hypothetical protein
LAVDLAGLIGCLVIDSPAEVRDALAMIGRDLVGEYDRGRMVVAEV